MKELSKIEETVLLAIWRLGDDAYGVEVKRKLEKNNGRSVNYSTLYATLEQMVRKGLIDKAFGEPASVRGGKRKVYFTPTAKGLQALKAAYERHRLVWAGISSDSFGDGDFE